MNSYKKILFDENDLNNLSLCHFCPKLCRHLCPIADAYAKETYIPGMKISALKLLLDGELAPSEELLDVLYACNGCRRCTEFCKHSVDVPELLSKGRALLAKEGFIHPELKGIRTAYARSSNQYGLKTNTELEKLVPKELVYDPSAEASTLLFFSADHILENPGFVKSTLKLMAARADRMYKVFTGPESCAGLPLLWSGNFDEFLDNGRRIVAALAKASIIITPSASMVAAMRSLYPDNNLVNIPKTMHISEYLCSSGDFSGFKQYKGEVYFLDSLLLANYVKVTEEPRKILAAACKEPVKEFSRNRSEAFSCGFEGLIDITMPEEAKIMSAEIFEEIESPDALIVTASVMAEKTLNDAGAPCKVTNLVDFLASRLSKK